MTPLVERITTGDVFWLRRSVARVAPREAHTEPDSFEANLGAAVRRDPRAKNAPVLDVRARIDLETAAMEASFEVLARFVFGNDEKMPSDEEAHPFLRDYGLDYAFGYVRAALVDEMRIFGFPAGIVPVDALDEPKKAGIRIDRPDAEPDEGASV